MAESGIGNLRVEQIEEIRRLRKPPDAVRRTLEVVCLILEAKEPVRGGPKPPTWDTVKRLLGDEAFLPRMMSFDFGTLRDSPQLVMLLRDQYFGTGGVCALAAPIRRGQPARAQEPLLYEKVVRASQAAGALFAWCSEVLAFVDTPREVKINSPTTKPIESSKLIAKSVEPSNPIAKHVQSIPEKNGTKASPRIPQADSSNGASLSNTRAARQNFGHDSTGGTRSLSMAATGSRDNAAKVVSSDMKQKQRQEPQPRAQIPAPSNPSSRPPSARAPALQAGAMAGLRPRPSGGRSAGITPADAKVSALVDLRQRFTELPQVVVASSASNATSSMPALPTKLHLATSQGGAKAGAKASLTSALSEAKLRNAEASGAARHPGAEMLPNKPRPCSAEAQVATFEAFARFAAGDAKVTRAPADVLRSVVGAIWRRRSLRVHISASLAPGESPGLADERLQAIGDFLASNGIKGLSTSVVGVSEAGSGALCELLLTEDRGLQDVFRRGVQGGDTTPRTKEAIEYLEENFKLCFKPGVYA